MSWFEEKERMMKENIAEKKDASISSEKKRSLGNNKKSVKEMGTSKMVKKVMFGITDGKESKYDSCGIWRELKKEKHNKVLPTVPYL